MAKLADGHIFIYKPKITAIEIEERELVMCRNCRYGEKANAVYLCGKSRGFGVAHEPDWFCADGERNQADGK